MLTSLDLARIRDATLMYVRFNVDMYVWLGLKNVVFYNLHRKVKTVVGSEVNPALRRRCYQYVWRCNVFESTPMAMLKALAKLVRNQDDDTCAKS